MRPISDVATDLGLAAGDLSGGSTWTKVPIRPTPSMPRGMGRYVLVTGTTPTGAGEGKTVTAIGLAMALVRAGNRAVVTLRQSSFGPTLGQKGGGAGGGAATIEPLDAAILGLGADQFAVETANNLLAARLDDLLWRGEVALDADQVWWRRVLDIDDRALRSITTHLDGSRNGPARTTGFDITAASEVMAVVALARDLSDLRARLHRLSVGFDRSGHLVTAAALGVAGAMAVLLREALQPNLLQTTEGTPALVHGGPFANVAHGCSSVVADRLALDLADYVVTEAGFGSELGAEKFLHLKVPAVGRVPDVIVLVTTVRALVAQGRSLHSRDSQAEALKIGSVNLVRHVRNLTQFGIPVIVALNHFPEDASQLIEHVADTARLAGADGFATHHAFAQGGAGCAELADIVAGAVRSDNGFRPLIQPKTPIAEQVDIIATRLYGAGRVRWTDLAMGQLQQLDAAGLGTLPVCMAKTPRSLSHDPARAGAPTGYEFPVEKLRAATGAGFVTVFAGDIQTMPGLPSRPRFLDFDLSPTGVVLGLV